MVYKIIYKFDEQSKAITASAGIEAEISGGTLEEVDELTKQIQSRSEKLMKDAVEFSAGLTRMYKR